MLSKHVIKQRQSLRYAKVVRFTVMIRIDKSCLKLSFCEVLI